MYNKVKSIFSLYLFPHYYWILRISIINFIFIQVPLHKKYKIA